jgi:phosphoglycolate phosphatase
VSNKPDKTTKIIVRQFFGDYISVVIGESPKIHRKPAPDTVNAAIGELFSEPWECVYIGDSEVDVETAKAAGMDCISVSWGFRTREQLIKAGATNIAATPEEVKKLL